MGLPETDPYRLQGAGLTPAERTEALEAMTEKLAAAGDELGWQLEWQPDLSGHLTEALTAHVNNIGDPYEDSGFGSHTKEMERRVLDYLADLWGAQPHHDPEDRDSYWGFLCSMGATEGNLFALWNAREYLTGWKLAFPDVAARGQEEEAEPVREPVLLFSSDSHYSIMKAARIVQLDTPASLGKRLYPGECPLDGDWPSMVPSTDGPDGPGTIDQQALDVLVRFFARRRHPAVIVLNAGTTFKGAFDDVRSACTNAAAAYRDAQGATWRARPDDQAEDDLRRWYWVHVDGALGTAYMPFLRMAVDRGEIPAGPSPFPAFDFRVPDVSSIVVSTHKWIGSPWPGGAYLTHNRYRMDPPDFPEYVGAQDTTIAGSRNGHSAVIMWEYFARHSHADQMHQAVEGLQTAQYAEQRLRRLQETHWPHLDLWVDRSEWSLSVRFRRPTQAIVDKAGLGGMTVRVKGEERQYVHLFTMRNTTLEQIDQLVKDLENPQAFD
ncbi:histidine decarboxylase [Streptomyces sp. SID14478]|uniref:pyridoxal-dependent decarboxylase n=1 Tax=Streptomyces sp. SID14478 TaxID=2706073 RepID=UPI0013E06F1C|nr:pyridoxal-dependent decarboxylase [Streptomyces sp. SID14478]NEB80886.1 histidine decarboxylase [Streptomyces sp. SID14478]